MFPVFGLGPGLREPRHPEDCLLLPKPKTLSSSSSSYSARWFAELERCASSDNVGSARSVHSLRRLTCPARTGSGSGFDADLDRTLSSPSTSSGSISGSNAVSAPSSAWALAASSAAVDDTQWVHSVRATRANGTLGTLPFAASDSDLSLSTASTASSPGSRGSDTGTETETETETDASEASEEDVRTPTRAVFEFVDQGYGLQRYGSGSGRVGDCDDSAASAGHTQRAEVVSLPVVFAPGLSFTLSTTSLDDADCDHVHPPDHSHDHPHDHPPDDSHDHTHDHGGHLGDKSSIGHALPSTPLLPLPLSAPASRKRIPAKSSLKPPRFPPPDQGQAHTLRARPSLWSLTLSPRRASTGYADAPRRAVTFAPRATYLTITEHHAPSWVRNCARTTRPVREGVYTLGMRHVQSDKHAAERGADDRHDRPAQPMPEHDDEHPACIDVPLDPASTTTTTTSKLASVTIKGIPLSHLSMSPRSSLASLSLTRVSSPGIMGTDPGMHDWDDRFEYRPAPPVPLHMMHPREVSRSSSGDTYRDTHMFAPEAAGNATMRRAKAAKAWFSRRVRRYTA